MKASLLFGCLSRAKHVHNAGFFSLSTVYTTDSRFRRRRRRKTVTLVVATTTDPASIGPASAPLATPGWHPSPSLQDAQSFVNREVRLTKLDNRLVKEDQLDKRREEATGEAVEEVLFLSKHVGSSNCPALTIHPIGETLVASGKPGRAAAPNPRIGPWLRLLKTIAQSHMLTPEFELVWQGLGLGGGIALGEWSRNDGGNKILHGIGGRHYVPQDMDIVLKENVWVGHLLSGNSVSMEDPDLSKACINAEAVCGTWREAIILAFEATKAAFPGVKLLQTLITRALRAGR